MCPGWLVREEGCFVKGLMCLLPAELWAADLKAGFVEMELCFRAHCEPCGECTRSGAVIVVFLDHNDTGERRVAAVRSM